MKNIEVRLTVSEELARDTLEETLAKILGADAARQVKALVGGESA